MKKLRKTGNQEEDYAILMMHRLLTPPEVNFYTIAMLDAFYSLLEHTFVLILPFLKHDLPTEITLEKFIGMNWKNKYHHIFSASDKTAVSQQLDTLIQIKEQYRNPLAHGYFQKNGHSFSVHMENLGAIPMALTKHRGSLSYGFEQPDEKEFNEICTALDKFEKFLAELPETKYGMIYIETGFLVAFDIDSRTRYMEAMTSKEAFEGLLDFTGYQIDSAANMDW